MGIKNVVTCLCLLLAISFSWNLQAQENLEALKKKHEKSSQLVKQVISRNGIQRVNESIKITITNNKEAVDEFINAFNKDSSDTIIALIRTENYGDGSTKEKDFILNKNGTLIRYNILIEDEANAIINYTKREGEDFLNQTLHDSATKKSLEKSAKELAKANKEAMEAAAKASKQATKAYEQSIKERERQMQIAAKTSTENLDAYEESIRKIEEAIKSAENLKKVKLAIPKGSYLVINGERVYADQARSLGYSVEEF